MVPFPSGPSLPLPIFNGCGNAASEALGRQLSKQAKWGGEQFSSILILFH